MHPVFFKMAGLSNTFAALEQDDSEVVNRSTLTYLTQEPRRKIIGTIAGL